MEIHKNECSDRVKLNVSLSSKIQPFLKPYGIEQKKLMTAIEKALHAIDNDNVSEILPLVFHEIFGGESIFWVNGQTPAGCEVSFDIMATAYAMWRDAQNVAFKRGLDNVDAAETLANAAYTVADRISGGLVIHNVRGYMFVCYIHALSQIEEKLGDLHLRRGKEKDASDNGAFVVRIETGILYRELVSAMPLKARKAAILRYAWGCSCKETAAEMGVSDNAARKTISYGIRKAFGVCMRELRTSGNATITPKRKTQKSSRQAVRL